MKVIVQRQPAIHPGPDIIEPLLSTPEGAIERGRAEIDKAGATKRVRQTIVYRDGERLGKLIEIRDATQGATWRGVVGGLTISGSGAEVTVQQEILRA